MRIFDEIYPRMSDIFWLLLSVKWVFVGDAGSTMRAEVLVTSQALHAERNEAEAEDPTTDQGN